MIDKEMYVTKAAQYLKEDNLYYAKTIPSYHGLLGFKKTSTICYILPVGTVIIRKMSYWSQKYTPNRLGGGGGIHLVRTQ